MDNLIESIRANSLLQAIAVVVAVATAIYYSARILFFVGKYFWSLIRPNVTNRVDRHFSRVRAKIFAAQNDVVILICDVMKQICFIIFFITLYFVSLFDTANDMNVWPTATQADKYVFMAAWTWNLIWLIGWLSLVSSERRNHIEVIPK